MQAALEVIRGAHERTLVTHISLADVVVMYVPTSYLVGDE